MDTTAKKTVTMQRLAKPSTEPARGPRTVSEMPTAELLSKPDGIDESHIDMARNKGVIVFRAKSTEDADLAAIAETRAKLVSGEPLVAVTGANTSLSDVRKLTRAGVTEVVPDTITPDEFEELIEELVRRSTPVQTRQRLGDVIAVTRARGGVGATTVAVNLADALLQRRGHFKKTTSKTVALVDLDMQFGDIASFLDVDPNDSLYDLAMSGKMPDENYVRQAIMTLPSGLSVLTAPNRFAPLDSLKGEQVARIVDILRQTHDYVVLDLPGALAEWMDPVVERADRVLMVTDCAVPSIRQARRLMDFFTESNPGLKFEVVINHEARPMLLRGHHAAAEKVLERRFSHWIPDDAPAAREALDRGVPVTNASPRSRMSRAISRLGRELAASLNQTQFADDAKAH